MKPAYEYRCPAPGCDGWTVGGGDGAECEECGEWMEEVALLDAHDINAIFGVEDRS